MPPLTQPQEVTNHYSYRLFLSWFISVICVRRGVNTLYANVAKRQRVIYRLIDCRIKQYSAYVRGWGSTYMHRVPCLADLLPDSLHLIAAIVF